jgi:hypothetical protein
LAELWLIVVSLDANHTLICGASRYIVIRVFRPPSVDLVKVIRRRMKAIGGCWNLRVWEAGKDLPLVAYYVLSCGAMFLGFKG